MRPYNFSLSMANGTMSGAAEVVVGTAGHIDHGKTALVRALTGIDTDRLLEEKRRGISIDIGFAHLSLPNGRSISFVDVPGHERFIKNMLAGAGGIQAVLLIVAADESVMPQTREHFDICRLLGIEHGLIVLTKADLATPEQMRIAQQDARALCEGSFLEGASIIPVSAVNGNGLEELKRGLSALAARIPARNLGGLARLPIDRSFALKGFGTVVTGTLWSGMLRTGDAVQLYPSSRRARIRGLQAHGESVDRVVAGQRTAVNLTGVDHSEIVRGFVLTHDSGLETTQRVDVLVDWINPAEIPAARRQFLLHIGTAEVPVIVKVLSHLAGSRTLARIWLDRPVLALPRDRFVLRRPSPAQTVAGGLVVDAFPPPRLNRAKTVARLSSLLDADLAKRIKILIEESANGRRVSELVRLTGAPAAQIEASILADASLLLHRSSQRAVSQAWIDQKRRDAMAFLAGFHAKHPSLQGAPMSLARARMDAELAALVFDNAPAFRIQGDVVALRTHKAQFSAQETDALSKIERAFRQAGFQPPAPLEVLRSAGVDAKRARGLLEQLIKAQKLVRVSDTLIFHADVIGHVRKSLSAHKGRRFSVPEFKDWTQISRKYAIPLLEYLDHQHVTRRDGDARVVL
jgi:selenocysteine-specific elongation factor